MSPSSNADTSYHRRYGSDASEGHEEEQQIHSDDTFQENDTTSQSPIIDNEKRPKLHRRKVWQEGDTQVRVTKAGRFYRSVMEFSFFTRWLIYILPIGILLAIPIIVGALKPDAAIGEVRIVWLFLWIEIVWLGLWVSKFFAHCLPCKSSHSQSPIDSV